MNRQQRTAAINAKVQLLTWGTELETIGLSTAEAANVLARFFGHARQYRGGTYTMYEVADNNGRIWKCMTDASLSAGREHSAEIVTPPMNGTEEDIQLVGQVAQALRRGGAKVDNSCGQHIHIGTRDANHREQINLRAITNICKIWAGKEDIILQAFNVSTSRISDWCRRMEERFIAQIRRNRFTNLNELNRAWFGYLNGEVHHYDGNRYHALNLNNIWRDGKTIELRIFNGTLNPTKIHARAQFALHLAATGCISNSCRISTPNLNGEQSPCYKMRCFLLDIGMIGEEYRQDRHEILRHLEGDTAWRTEEQREEHYRRRRHAGATDEETEAADQRREEARRDREARRAGREAAQNTAAAHEWNNGEASRAWREANQDSTAAIDQVAVAAHAILAMQRVITHPATNDLAQDVCSMFTHIYDTEHAARRLNVLHVEADRIANDPNTGEFARATVQLLDRALCRLIQEVGNV